MPIGELARRREIPVQFLEQLFAVAAPRRRPQLPARRQGRLLASPASRARSPCSRSSSCSTARSAASAEGIFADAAAAARDVLAQTTIADVIEREAREAGAAMYYI